MSDLMQTLLGQWNYFLVITLMMIGFYAVIARGNMVKKMVGLNIFQTSVFMLYISMGKISEGTAPILTGEADTLYSNPLPHVLILTAIVVGVATTAVGYALIIRIQESFGTIEDDDIIVLMDDEPEATVNMGDAS
jgi:multicomponent Na+:H+ antiporter subunit C